MSVVVETTIGDITVDLFTEERPVACLNFVKLCKLKYYNYNLFHKVEQGFIAQTGDPSGDGGGGSSVWGVLEGTTTRRFFEAESIPKIYHSSVGLLSLVSAGKSMVGSQFFFTLGSNLTSLDGTHCVIGEVVEGQEVLRKLNESIVDESCRPYQDIRITHTVILDDPFPDPRGFHAPSRSPSPSAGRLQNGRIAADEDIDDTEGKSLQDIQEMLQEREAKARATILEIVGDLPDAEMAPPENVLFICKLNPVTSDDDLEIIFSRFGKVKSCEVIRDKKTNDSLQYAFVEFEDQKSCEAAYFKMDNVLIDDRRIHVDFSQSVAKVKWRGKGRGVEGADGRLDFNNLRNDGRKRDRGEKVRRNGSENQNRSDRGRQNSEERRKAREERHRELHAQELKAKRRRSRSRSEPRKRDDRRDGERRRGKTAVKISGRGDSGDRRRGKMPASRRHSRSRSRELPRRRSRNRSPEFSRRRSAERRRSPVGRHRPEPQATQQRIRNAEIERRRKQSPEKKLSAKRQQKPESEHDEKRKKTSKKHKHQFSSEDSITSDAETSDSSSDSSSSNSSSAGERKKKQKTSKSKKSKASKKKKKHKK